MSHVGIFLCPICCGLNGKYQCYLPSTIEKRKDGFFSPAPHATMCSLTKWSCRLKPRCVCSLPEWWHCLCWHTMIPSPTDAPKLNTSYEQLHRFSDASHAMYPAGLFRLWCMYTECCSVCSFLQVLTAGLLAAEQRISQFTPSCFTFVLVQAHYLSIQRLPSFPCPWSVWATGLSLWSALWGCMALHTRVALYKLLLAVVSDSVEMSYMCLSSKQEELPFIIWIYFSTVLLLNFNGP